MNVGDKTKEFELKDQKGNLVKLLDFKGRKLLAFFPFAFSPVCTDELSCFMKDYNLFHNKNVQIIGISVDSHWSNKAFSDSLALSFPILSDFDKKVSQEHGVLRKEGFSERAYFLIDGKGIIVFKKIMDTPKEKLSSAELLKLVS